MRRPYYLGRPPQGRRWAKRCGVWRSILPAFFPLPHPSWRNLGVAQAQPLVRKAGDPRTAKARRALMNRVRTGIIRARMKLLSSPASPYTRKVRIVLAEKKIECD